MGCVSFEVMVTLRPKPQFVRRPLYDVQYKTKQASGGSGGMARGPRASLNLEKKNYRRKKSRQDKQNNPPPPLSSRSESATASHVCDNKQAAVRKHLLSLICLDLSLRRIFIILWLLDFDLICFRNSTSLYTLPSVSTWTHLMRTAISNNYNESSEDQFVTLLKNVSFFSNNSID